MIRDRRLLPPAGWTRRFLTATSAKEQILPFLDATPAYCRGNQFTLSPNAPRGEQQGSHAGTSLGGVFVAFASHDDDDDRVVKL